MNQPFYVLMHISNRLSKDKTWILPHKLRSNSWEQKHAIDSQGFIEILKYDENIFLRSVCVIALRVRT